MISDVERLHDDRASKGLEADIVLVYPLADATSTGVRTRVSPTADATSKTADAASKFAVQQDAASTQAREALLSKLKAGGLCVTTIQTSDAQHMLVKVTACRSRLVEEAERQKLVKLLEAQREADPLATRAVTHAEYQSSRIDDFARSAGLLFSSLERQRLVLGLIDSAGVQLDELCADETLLTYYATHDRDAQRALGEKWSRFGCWPFAGRRLGPDLGVFQQPIGEVREYFGENVALYFAWLEHYSTFLLVLAVAGIVIQICLWVQGKASGAVPVYALGILTVWVAAQMQSWKRVQDSLAHVWCNEEFGEREPPRTEFVASFRRGPWRSAAHGGSDAMRREKGTYTAAGAQQLNWAWPTANAEFVSLKTADAEQEPVLVMSTRARYLAMCLGAPVFFGLLACALIVNLAVLMFLLVMSVSLQYNGGEGHEQHPTLNSTSANAAAGMLNAVAVSVMNGVYSRVAVWLTDIENHRTASEHEDALLRKKSLFHFLNEYSSLIYIAYLKAVFDLQTHNYNSYSSLDTFGLHDPQGQPYRDTCGLMGTEPYSQLANGRHVFVRSQNDGGCMRDFWIQMLFLVVAKPLYEIPLRLLVPKVVEHCKKVTRRSLVKRNGMASGTRVVEGVEGGATTGDATSDAELLAHRSALEDELAKDEFHGTFGMFDTKLVQFGYVVMFSSAFPLAAAAAVLANMVELRIEAHKMLHATRRPRYRRAKHFPFLGVLSTYSWVALMLNILICACLQRDSNPQSPGPALPADQEIGTLHLPAGTSRPRSATARSAARTRAPRRQGSPGPTATARGAPASRRSARSTGFPPPNTSRPTPSRQSLSRRTACATTTVRSSRSTTATNARRR